MEKKETRKLELNEKILQNFEQIMSTKLDEIEELKITDLVHGSKLFNIISLCANLKTLVIEGDHRVNCDKILNHVLKKENLENLVLNGVKLPKVESLKKYTGLKMLSFYQIQICPIQEFLGGIACPEKLEIINISNTNLLNNSLAVLESFKNLKYIHFEHLQNVVISLDFLKEQEQLLKISIEHQKIPITEVNNLLKCRCMREIGVELTDQEGTIIPECHLQVNSKNKVTMIIPALRLEEISQKVDFYRIDNIIIKVNSQIEEANFVKLLKKHKKQVKVEVKNFACISVQQAKKMKETLKMKQITVGEETSKVYDMDDYIEIRSQIEDLLKNISKHLSEEEKFLEIYKILGQEMEYLKMEDLSIAEILQNCLECVKISANVIQGEELKKHQPHAWNQVELNGKWYHVDLALDLENSKKKKAEYCLLGDKAFFETHLPKAGENHYCAEDFNQKIVKVFFKTGIFEENLIKSYFEMTIEKMKKMLHINEGSKVLALPSGKECD